MQQRKDEILAKKAKLAELKKQREQRQKEFAAGRQSLGSTSERPSTPSNRAESRKDLDSLISSLVGDDRGSATPGTPSPRRNLGTTASPASTQKPQQEDGDADTSQAAGVSASTGTQTLSFAPHTTVYELKSEVTKQPVESYSIGVQTTGLWGEERGASESDTGASRSRSRSGERPSKRKISRRQEEREEEIRQSLRKEIEAELRAIRDPDAEQTGAEDEQTKKANFPARALTTEESEAVTSSHDFLDFVERSSKVIERALDEEYDVLADYAARAADGLDDDDDVDLGAGGTLGSKGRKSRRIKESMQLFDERWSKRRMISDINFSPKFPELLLAAYTKNPSAPYEPSGVLQVWNTHMQSRPEYVFHSTSDILTAQFSPFHPNLIFGGNYSGQVLVWDTRNRSPDPVQRTPLTGTGHTHPVYSLNVVGTQNAHNVISTSTDGVLCTWSVDMLTHPQEYLELLTPSTLPPSIVSGNSTATPMPISRLPPDLSPLCTAFPPSDPTYLMAGCESGLIHLIHRYDRAGARAGPDSRMVYGGHAGPVVSLDYHSSEGPVDLGDLLLSASVDWTVRLWRVRTPAASSINATTEKSGAATSGHGNSAAEGQCDIIAPVLTLPHSDAVYCAKWSPVKPGVFALGTESGTVEVWDLAVETEIPVAAGTPAKRLIDGMEVPSRSLNKVAWEGNEGKRIAVGGIDGVLSVWDVGGALGGQGSARSEEWTAVRKLVRKGEEAVLSANTNGRSA